MAVDVVEFEKLSSEAQRATLSYAYLCCRDLNLAEDIVQETLTIAFQKRDQYFPESNFATWLIAIARNVWFRERQRRRLHPRATSYMDDNAALLFNERAYEDAAWTEESDALRGCLRKLCQADQKLIEAHFSGNKKYAEIAADLNRTLAWVKMRMHRARIALLKCVKVSVTGNDGDR